MRRNAFRVIDFEDQLIQEIFRWFKSRPEIDGVNFTKDIPIKLDVETGLDYDLGTEKVIIVSLINDGTLVLDDDREIGLEGLNPYELAFILDELEEENYIIKK